MSKIIIIPKVSTGGALQFNSVLQYSIMVATFTVQENCMEFCLAIHQILIILYEVLSNALDYQ